MAPSFIPVCRRGSRALSRSADCERRGRSLQGMHGLGLGGPYTFTQIRKCLWVDRDIWVNKKLSEPWWKPRAWAWAWTRILEPVVWRVGDKLLILWNRFGNITWQVLPLGWVDSDCHTHTDEFWVQLKLAVLSKQRQQSGKIFHTPVKIFDNLAHDL